ncbi:VAN3-binding protein isoform X1 [Tanacetum coccineum]
MMFFYTELGLMDYTVIISNNPLKLAASSVYATRCTLKKTLAHYHAKVYVIVEVAEVTEAMGAECEHLIVVVVNSVFKVKSHGDILTLTVVATTALRGAATLKTMALKEVWNTSVVIPVDRRL